MKEKNPVIFIYCDIIYTKIFRPDTPGEFFKGHYNKTKFPSNIQPRGGEGTGKSLRGFHISQYKKIPQGIPS